MRVLALLVCLLVPISGAADNAAANPERCDPRHDGFFENIGCGQEWQHRQAERQSRLEELRRQYELLRGENSSLAIRRDAEAALVAHLQAQVTESRRNLGLVQAEVSSWVELEARHTLLLRELELIGRSIDAALLIETGCETVELREARQNLKLQRAVVDEAIGLGVGYLVSEAAESAFSAAMPKKLKAVVKAGFRVLDLIAGFFGAVESAKRIHEAYEADRTAPTSRLACI